MATFPKFIPLNEDQEIIIPDAEEDDADAEDRKEPMVAEVDKTVLLDDGPDEVHIYNLEGMEANALQSIPDIHVDAHVNDDSNYDADKSNSVDLENTEKLMEKIQKQARQLVAFENYVDDNEVMENDDQAENDEYMLVVLKDKDKTKGHIQMNNEAIRPIGVCAYKKEEDESKTRNRKTLGKRRGGDDDSDVEEVVWTELQ